MDVVEATKVCRKCDEDKPLSLFYRDKGGRDGRRTECKACFSQAMVARQKADPKRADYMREWRQAKARDQRLRLVYGITAAEYDAMLAEQGGGCAICGEAAGSRRLHVDHDHTSGDVRGLLCHGCNTGIGLFREDPAVLAAAISYLARARSE